MIASSLMDVLQTLQLPQPGVGTERAQFAWQREMEREMAILRAIDEQEQEMAPLPMPVFMPIPTPPIPTPAQSAGIVESCMELSETQSHTCDVRNAASKEFEQTAQPQQLRFHAEWAEQGVRLWLGADRQMDASIPHIASQVMRWLGDQGVHLQSIVCNGRTVYASEYYIDSIGNGKEQDGN